MPKYVVRYGSMRALGVLNTRGGDRFPRGARVIARTNRGLEAGEVLTEATDDAVANLRDPASGQILREMTADDENELAHIQSNLGSEFEACRKHVEALKLQMDLVDIEHVFGGERIVVYYLAEQRVDFRELVKRLASEFQTRIEMRQIGVRDEAKLLADYGDCGKPVCCNSHLSAMPPVSMKMAKLQKATLDPTKISGRCGRLKCCLRYEYDTYEELQKELPPVGSDIVTSQGNARVLSQEILSQQLLVQSEDNRRMVIDANEVLSITRRGSGKRSKPRPKDRGEPTEGGESKPNDSGRGSSEAKEKRESGKPRGRDGKSRSRDGRSRSRGGRNQDKDAPRSSHAGSPEENAPVESGDALTDTPPTPQVDKTDADSSSQPTSPENESKDSSSGGGSDEKGQKESGKRDGKSRRRRSNQRKPKRP